MDSIIQQVKDRVGPTEAEAREDIQQLFQGILASLLHLFNCLILKQIKVHSSQK